MKELIPEIEKIIKSLNNIVEILEKAPEKPVVEEKSETDPKLQEILDFIKDKMEQDKKDVPFDTPFNPNDYKWPPYDDKQRPWPHDPHITD